MADKGQNDKGCDAGGIILNKYRDNGYAENGENVIEDSHDREWDPATAHMTKGFRREDAEHSGNIGNKGDDAGIDDIDIICQQKTGVEHAGRQRRNDRGNKAGTEHGRPGGTEGVL